MEVFQTVVHEPDGKVDVFILENSNSGSAQVILNNFHLQEKEEMLIRFFSLMNIPSN